MPSLARTKSKSFRWSATCWANFSSLAVARTIERPLSCSTWRSSRRAVRYGSKAGSSRTRRAISRFKCARPLSSQKGRANRASGSCRNKLQMDSIDRIRLYERAVEIHDERLY